MQLTIPFQAGRDLYLRWVAQNSKRQWPKFATIEAACLSEPALELHAALADAWPLTADDYGDIAPAEDARAVALGWLAGISCAAMRRAPRLATRGSAAGFLVAWAKRAPNLRESRRIDINESRFLRWVKASDWSAFYAETITMLPLLHDATIDAGSLYDIARMRADSIVRHSDAFSLGAASMFYEAQPVGAR
ncbi:hypothetical protein [Ralstonia pseudosolanacearum]